MVIASCVVDVFACRVIVIVLQCLLCLFYFCFSFFLCVFFCFVVFFFQAEDGIRDLVRSRGLGDVYKRQVLAKKASSPG